MAQRVPSRRVDVYCYNGTDFVFHPCKWRDEPDGQRSHSRQQGVSFVVNEKTEGPRTVAGLEVIIPALRPSALFGSRFVLAVKLGYALLQAFDQCKQR